MMFYDPDISRVTDLRTPSIAGLAHYLRNLPEDFEWNFFDCYHCAMGVARRIWPERISVPNVREVSAAIGISEATGEKLFMARNVLSVTPGAIAVDLDALVGA